jgi:hypothetical protein
MNTEHDSKPEFTQAQFTAALQAFADAHENRQFHKLTLGSIKDVCEYIHDNLPTLLSALATPPPADAPTASGNAAVAGKFKLGVFMNWVVIQYAQDNPYQGQLFPSVEAAMNAIVRDYSEAEALLASDSLSIEESE